MHLAHCGTQIILLPVLWKILNHSFRIVENLHWNFNNLENLNCTFHIVENITKYFPYCGNYQHFFHIILLTILLWNFCCHTFRFPHCVWNFLFNLLCTLWNIDYLTSSFVENLKPFFPPLDIQ